MPMDSGGPEAVAAARRCGHINPCFECRAFGLIRRYVWAGGQPNLQSGCAIPCAAIGKTPIQTKDVTGFVVNRVHRVMMIEAIRLVEDVRGDGLTALQ